MRRTTLLLLPAVIAGLAVGPLSSAAAADVERTKRCGTTWLSIDVDREGGGFEVSTDLETKAAGERWRIRVRQDGKTLARVVRTTDAEGEIDLETWAADTPGSETFRVRARHLDSGKVLWKSDPRQAAHAAIARAGNTIFSLEDDSELVVIRLNREKFEPVARYKVATSDTWSQPVISGNRVFVKDVSSLTLWTIN